MDDIPSISAHHEPPHDLLHPASPLHSPRLDLQLQLLLSKIRMEESLTARSPSSVTQGIQTPGILRNGRQSHSVGPLSWQRGRRTGYQGERTQLAHGGRTYTLFHACTSSMGKLSLVNTTVSVVL
jgi:hypothetical protein